MGSPAPRDGLTVTHVAIKGHDGTVHSLPAPNRHHHVIRMMAAGGEPIPINGEQGFLLSDGRFARRHVAKYYAKEAGQIIDGQGFCHELFSEDVW